MANIQAHTDPGFNATKGRPTAMFWGQETPKKINLVTGWTGQNPPYNGYIGMDTNYNIAHYGYKFADGNRMGHWEIVGEGTVAYEGATTPVISLRQSYNGQTRYLTALEAGDMRVMLVPEGALSDAQRFVITGH